MKLEKFLDKHTVIIFVLLLLTHFIFLINTKFTLWPEMMVYPYLTNNGFDLYTDLINPYPPSFIFFLSQFSKLFNYSITSYQLLTWTIIIFIDLIIFLLTQKIFKKYYLSITSSIFFTFFSIPFGINQLWFDLIQTPLILFSAYNFYLFIKEKKLQNLDLSVLFALAAFFIKQQSIWLIIFYVFVVWIIYKRKTLPLFLKIKKTYVFLVLAVIVHLLLFLKFKTLPDFLFWVIYFPFFKASSMPGYLSLPTLRQLLTISGLALFFLPVATIKKREFKIILLSSLPLMLFAYPRFDYFHVIPALAVLSLLVGKNIQLVLNSSLVVKIVVTTATVMLLVFNTRFLSNNWTTEIRFFENDILASASMISIFTSEQDKIYIQNGPDQLLPLALRLPPKPWIDEFPWYLENNTYQQRVTSALKNEKVKFIVYKEYSYDGQYELGSYIPQEIASYANNNYEKYIQLSGGLWLNKRKSFN